MGQRERVIKKELVGSSNYVKAWNIAQVLKPVKKEAPVRTEENPWAGIEKWINHPDNPYL